ncbi:hypothetical protein [Rhodococcus sp. NBC_00297]|uniref:hypothetical protein n=1 Tax=Rhodococcus sp. NBC_00297 TaxID=2976005 RepID=UPI002E290E21|nr:hypothetical protein [Rhodococcus sp. NBC_00297]
MASMLDVMNEGHGRANRLNRADDLRMNVEKILAFRREHFETYGLMAANPRSERLIGAAMMLDPSIRADLSGNTIILGINIASGTQLARAAAKIRLLGNRSVVVGIVVNSLSPDWAEWKVPEVDSLFVTSEWGENLYSGLVFGKGAKRCERGLRVGAI